MIYGYSSEQSLVKPPPPLHYRRLCRIVDQNMCLRTSELAAFDVCFHPVEIRKTFKLHLTIYVQGQSLVPVKEVVRSIYGEVESKVWKSM